MFSQHCIVRIHKNGSNQLAIDAVFYILADADFWHLVSGVQVLTCLDNVKLTGHIFVQDFKVDFLVGNHQQPCFLQIYLVNIVRSESARDIPESCAYT